MSFRYVVDWRIDDAAQQAAILDFWRRESAIADPTQAQARVREVVLHALDAHGAVAAVCTVVPVTLPRLGEPMYYYRCFVGRAWRTTRVAHVLLKRAFDVLEAYARETDDPCIGVVLELENARFGETLRRAVWTGVGFVYIGRSARDLDLRVRYFRGARLGRSRSGGAAR